MRFHDLNGSSYLSKGVVTRQAHVDIPEGTFEEEHGLEGFYGPVSQLYHSNAPTAWSRIEGPLKPRLYNCHKLPVQQSLNPISGRVTLLHNADVSMAVWRPQSETDYFIRNADGDELFFIHKGSGLLETDYGPLHYESGDYLVVPRGVTYRFLPDSNQPNANFILIFESPSHIKQPDRGMMGQHALYDQSVITTPSPQDFNAITPANTEYEVKVKRQNQITSFYYPFHPLDVIGWKGNLYPWKINVRDICPVMSHRAHLPPSVHTTFLAQGFVICTFLPRPLETAEGAMRVPFYHRNIDYDEVLFYHAGDFFSRDGISEGMVTFHPQGFHHGPHPNAIEKSWSKTETDEIAVMLDTRRPLNYTPEAEQSENHDYWKSWGAK